jgi:hypothetical protein
MKTAGAKLSISLVLLLPLTVAASLPASAKLTPLQQVPFDQPDVTSLHTGPAAAMLERDYFQAPQQPIVTRRATPCTVQMVVFDKSRLAQACY